MDYTEREPGLASLGTELRTTKKLNPDKAGQIAAWKIRARQAKLTVAVFTVSEMILNHRSNCICAANVPFVNDRRGATRNDAN